jgi:hypothetical protein
LRLRTRSSSVAKSSCAGAGQGRSNVRLGQGRRRRARQQGVQARVQLARFGVLCDQFAAHVGLLDLRADHVLLGRQTAGVTHLGDLFQTHHQIQDFQRQSAVALQIEALGLAQS